MRRVQLIVLLLVLLAACAPAVPLPPSADLILHAWADLDADAERDPAEPGVAGVELQLLGAALPIMATSAGGVAVWSGPLKGCWPALITAPAGWQVVFGVTEVCLQPDDVTMVMIGLEAQP